MPAAEGTLHGRVAVVTGGSRGIGAGVVRALAADGADVVVASRKVTACRRVADEVVAAHGVRALAVAYDAGRWEDAERLVEETYAELGRVDVLVNNAGMSPRYDHVTDVSEALWSKVVGVNLGGPFRLTALLGTRMAEAGGGTVINVSSIAADRPDPTALPYSAAKAGLNALGAGFAQLLGPTVRVNTVQPGPVLTDIADHWAPGTRERLDDTVALGRCAAPEEVVAAVCFLAGGASSYVTGSVLRVDGGWP